MNSILYGAVHQGLLGVEDLGDGYKLAVVNVGGTHHCAYVQFPGVEDIGSYDDVHVEAHVHGGFTFLGSLSTYGLDGMWLGWDYAHFGDYMFRTYRSCKPGEKMWTTEEVVKEGLDILKSIKDGKWKYESKEVKAMKFVFISLPMSGKTDKEIGHRLCSINGAVKKACVEKFGWKWDDIRTIDNFWDHDRIDDNPDMPVKKDSVFYLGGALQKMSRADAVYFDEGWEHANGCLVERFAALKYDIPVLFYNVEYGGVVNEEKEV